MDFSDTISVDGSDTPPGTTDFRDKMTFLNDWFLLGSPIPIGIIIASYLLFVLKIGPDYMKNRKPYKLRKLLLLYNAMQVAISAALFYMCVNILSIHGFFPKSCLMETPARRLMIVSGTYYYFLAKISELLDTLFFVLRKKNNQITFLHVYHHAYMVFISWITLKFEPTYMVVMLGTLNAFVHIVMYAYYGLSAFPDMAPYLWWKKYITTMQIIQFVLVLIHYCIQLVNCECKPSIIMACNMIWNLSLFLYLFVKFYVDTYNKNKAQANVDLKNKLNRVTEVVPNDTDKEVHKANGKYTEETTQINANRIVNRKITSIGNR